MSYMHYDFIDTPNSSPIRAKKFSSKRIQTIWSAIKRFSPVHRLKNSSRNKKKFFKPGERLYASHPDISCNNLVVLTQIESKRSQDDTDAIRMSRSVKSKQPLSTFFVDNPELILPLTDQRNTNIRELSLDQVDNLVSFAFHSFGLHITL